MANGNMNNKMDIYNLVTMLGYSKKVNIILNIWKKKLL